MPGTRTPADYANIICQQAVLGESGNPTDLQNINTDPLPNGALAYVIGKRAAYVLDKFSDATANGSDVYAPGAGPGRWVLFGSAAGAAPPVMAYSTEGNSNAFAVDAAFNQSSGSSFAANEGNELSRWTFTAAGCILTWNGATLPMLVTMTMAVSVGNADAARTVTGFVSLNDETPAATNGGSGGKTSVVFNHANASQILATQRFITAVTNGSTLRPKLAGPAAAVSLLADSVQLIVQPL